MIPESTGATEQVMRGELATLEERIEQVAALLRRLSEERKNLEAECIALRSERQEAAETLSRLIDKVDALRGEI